MSGALVVTLKGTEELACVCSAISVTPALMEANARFAASENAGSRLPRSKGSVRRVMVSVKLRVKCDTGNS